MSRPYPKTRDWPAWIIYLIDVIAEKIPREQARELLYQVDEVLPRDVNLSVVKHQFIYWVLVDPEHGVMKFNHHKALQDVASLHQRIIDGVQVRDEEFAIVEEAADAAEEASRYYPAMMAARAASSSCVRAAAAPLPLNLAWTFGLANPGNYSGGAAPLDPTLPAEVAKATDCTSAAPSDMSVAWTAGLATCIYEYLAASANSQSYGKAAADAARCLCLAQRDKLLELLRAAEDSKAC